MHRKFKDTNAIFAAVLILSSLIIGPVAAGKDEPAKPASVQYDVPYPPAITVATTSGPVEDFILAGAGSQAVILIGDPEPPKYIFPFWGGEKLLQRYLFVITGIEVPIMDYRKFETDTELNRPETYRIWVGRQPKVEAAIGKELAGLDDDGYVIKAEGRDLYICGKQYWGTHWAPHDLLERAAGCRWYMVPPRFWMPKEDGMVGLGDIIPKAETVKIPGNTLIVETPSYRTRWFMVVDVHSFRVRYRDRFVHNLGAVFAPTKYGKTHPEYYPLIQGKRFVPGAGHEQEFQPCVSNPGTVDVAVAAAIEAFEKGDSCFGLGMNDGSNFCECEKCNAIAPADLKGKEKRIAYAFFDWYNRIANRLYDKYPDRRIGCLAYAMLSSLPGGTIKLHPMVVPYLTRDSAQLFDPAEIKEFRETVDRWSKLAARMGIYEYIYGQGFYIPRIYNRYILKNIKELYGVGCESFYAEASPQWALDAPKYWFISKLVWNHRYRIEDLYNDYYRNMFGPAAPEMRTYFEYLEEVWCTQTLESNRSNYRWLNDPKQFEIFTPDKCEKAISLIQRAADKVKAKAGTEEGDMILKRIAFFRQGIDFTYRMSLRYDAEMKLADLLKASGESDLEPVKALPMLDRWFQGGTSAELYKMRNAAGLDTTHAMPYWDFNYQWSRNPSPYETLYRLTSQLKAEALKNLPERSLARYRKSADAVLAKWKTALGGVKADLALYMIGETTRDGGILFVRSAPKDPEPVIDGDIKSGEWGEPAYSGKLIRAYTTDRSSYRTTVYAMEIDGENLFLAFDCEGDPKLIGGNVSGRNTDTAYPRKMFNDDAIAINIKPPAGHIYLDYGFNVNGAVRAPDEIKSAARRTDKGWQLEMKIPKQCIGTLCKEKVRDGLNTALCISRYERIPTDDGKGTVGSCYTLLPVGRIGSTVGAGNHDTLMTFIWGLTILYENPTK